MIRAIDIVRPELFALRLRKGAYRSAEYCELEKRCSTCREYWPADEEFYYTSRSEPDGLTCLCKACYLDRRYPHGRIGTLHAANSAAP